MQKWLLILMLGCALLWFLPQSNAQDFKLNNGLGAKVVLIDHYTPRLLTVAAVEGWANNVTLGGEVAYYRGLNRFLNLAIPLRLGLARPFLPSDNPIGADSEFFASLDATLQLQPWLHKSRVSPYLLAGIGGFYVGDNVSAEIPLGLGVNFRLTDQLFAQIQGEFRKDLSPNRDNLMYSLGIMYALGAKKEVEPTDRDGDGVPDAQDRCPDDIGLAAQGGCPDRDRDGLVDRDDKCPSEAGPKENQGCPLSDRDGDGLIDAEDDCPDEAGRAEDGGCPDTDGDGVLDKNDPCPLVAGKINGCPDRDGDGLIDRDDRCPDQPGLASNQGCPEISNEVQETLDYVAQNVAFETGRATLVESSFAILDQVVLILNQYPNYSVAIGGHTDSVGGAATNQLLSERRAKSCFEYLQRRGISSARMNYVGYGETRPIADNRYKEGREQNRRVEFNLFLP